jgi:hypothetical protein
MLPEIYKKMGFIKKRMGNIDKSIGKSKEYNGKRKEDIKATIDSCNCSNNNLVEI